MHQPKVKIRKYLVFNYSKVIKKQRLAKYLNNQKKMTQETRHHSKVSTSQQKDTLS